MTQSKQDKISLAFAVKRLFLHCPIQRALALLWGTANYEPGTSTDRAKRKIEHTQSLQ